MEKLDRDQMKCEPRYLLPSKISVRWLKMDAEYVARLSNPSYIHFEILVSLDFVYVKNTRESL